MRKFNALLVLMALVALFIPQVSFGFCTDNVPTEFMDAAKSLHGEKVLRGNPDGGCNLGGSLNRVEFATFVLRNNYTDEDIKDLAAMEKGTFPDLESGIWYFDLAKAAKFEGLLKGDGDTGKGRFADGVNAAEAVIITLRGTAIEIPAPASGEAWYGPAMNIAKTAGVKTFDPTHKMTRGDAVLLIHQVNENYDAIEAAAKNYSPSNSSTSTTSSRGDLTKLIVEFEQLSSSEGNKIYDGLTDTQKKSINALAQNFSLILHVGLCEANSSRVLDSPVGRMDCTQGTQALTTMLNSYDEAAIQQLQSSLQNELLMLIVREACKNQEYEGDITAESCGQFLGQVEPYIAQYSPNTTATTVPDTGSTGGSEWSQPEYWLGEDSGSSSGGAIDPSVYQMMSDMSASMHNTNMSIINNIGGGTNCTLGTAGCVPF